ncbi:SRPBCC family protein [Nonomuraea glycinis]|uniref:Carbon monoxide dehydrogenase subunit G n=1 Tax=Nonomuraea glycinis TaxID=2047744 RepID=A0A918A7E6_9ACTN|nr:SRPBCC family protein [Nonomuraea glycinis]MCA2179877.1 SRPBCC family protein [Nonomuraea glycinis]GGP10426.1 carbon monoxide dehydrogenase subunit G [Nonomuraea glycinis]
MAMRFEHEFTVPVPIEQAWAVLLDVERVAPCLPGAALDVFEGEEFTGRMKVKVGPITVTYRGSATFEDVDKDAHTLTLRASGKEARGSGTAAATVKARLTPGDGSTAVAVETTFNVTGRPAQFGRGVMAEVGSKLIDRFAVNLAELLAEPVPEPPKDEAPKDETLKDETLKDEALKDEPDRHLAAVPAPEVRPSGTTRTSLTPDEEALNLLEIAGRPLLKRVAPALGGLAALLLLGWLIRRLTR